jgi:4-alpha-glucanotransferase
VVTWWESLGKAERAAVLEIPALKRAGPELGATFTPAVHRALADALNGSGSELVLFLIQDILGTKERINTPATVGPHNWSYRLPATIEELRADPGIFKLTEMLRRSVEAAGR